MIKIMFAYVKCIQHYEINMFISDSTPCAFSNSIPISYLIIILYRPIVSHYKIKMFLLLAVSVCESYKANL